MSTYIRMTKSPRTGKFTPALWQDDYFGQHNYGVKFLGEEYYYRPDGLETNDDPIPDKAVNELYGYEKKATTMNKSDCCKAKTLKQSLIANINCLRKSRVRGITAECMVINTKATHYDECIDKVIDVICSMNFQEDTTNQE